MYLSDQERSSGQIKGFLKRLEKGFFKEIGGSLEHIITYMPSSSSSLISYISANIILNTETQERNTFSIRNKDDCCHQYHFYICFTKTKGKKNISILTLWERSRLMKYYLS